MGVDFAQNALPMRDFSVPKARRGAGKPVLAGAASPRRSAKKQHRTMIIGLLAGLAAGAVWGLVFVGPAAVMPYTSLDLTVARYLAFGIGSLVLMLTVPRCRAGIVPRRDAGAGLVLGLTGYVVYYLLAAGAVQLAGPAIPPLVIGSLPVVLALVGNWRERTVRWRTLAMPLGLILAGLALVNIATLAGADSAASRANVVLGCLCALGAVAVWTIYALVNARTSRALAGDGVYAWTSLQGVGSLVGVLPLVPLLTVDGWSSVPQLGLFNADGLRLVLWAVLLGMVSSWVGAVLWIIAARRLPVAFAGQLIVSETVFALVYGFLFEGRWPTPGEVGGAGLLMLGVFAAASAFRRAEEGSKDARLVADCQL
ncbi:hypothetical protein AVW15_11780 [Chelatococcus daeguensis]|nr:hypothetical protein AVW15_11780 [Chelatococcus daeguensis]